MLLHYTGHVYLGELPARTITRLLWSAPFLYLLYLFRLTGVGLLSHDEPRYAAIGQDMAISGDWITPRLWGSAWFEKPPLLYWLQAVAYQLGLRDELAARLPVALGSIAFLLFFFWILRREFGERTALMATLILGTSAGWLAYSFVAVTDLLMSATLFAALLLCLSAKPQVIAAGILLGLSVLAKGLVPLVLFVPVVWLWRNHWKDLWRLGGVALAVSLPWYALCTARNGTAFLNEFFVKHHFARFATDSLQHVQPFWYYIPILIAGLFPWSPLIPALFRNWPDPRHRFLLLWLAWGWLFFSISRNKLPGYVLPLLLPLSILLASALNEMKDARWWLLSAGLVLLAMPAIGEVLPQALVRGLRKSQWDVGQLRFVLPFLIVGPLCWLLETRGKRLAAVGVLAASITCGVTLLKISVFPQLDAAASVRPFWKSIEQSRDAVCLGEIDRRWAYGLNYYAGRQLPACKTNPFPLQVEQNSEKDLISAWR